MCKPPYPEIISKETGQIIPEFHDWMEYVLTKVNGAAEVVAEKILNHKNLSNLSSEEDKIFRSEILGPHATKTNCSACYDYFVTWEQQRDRIRIGDQIAIHAHCEQKYKLKLLKERKTWNNSKGILNSKTVDK